MYGKIIVILLLMTFIYTFLIEYFGYIPDNDIRYPIKPDPKPSSEPFAINNYEGNAVLGSANVSGKYDTPGRKEKKRYDISLEYVADPKFAPVTYQSDYKPVLNQENRYAFVPYYEFINKDILPENTLSITQELTYQEMNKYLKKLQKTVNVRINNKNVLDFLKLIKRGQWIEKEVVSETVFDQTSIAVDNQAKRNFVRYEQIFPMAELLVHNFVNLLNKEFMDTNYFKKYNKHHTFSQYTIDNIKILKHFEYKNDENSVKVYRFILIFLLHRKDKINDFYILSDYFLIAKKGKIVSLKALGNITNFENDNYIFIKKSFVLGMPISHNYKYLDFDDTKYIFKIIPLIDHITKQNILNIEQLSTSITPTENIKKYKELLEFIKNIDLNKNLNENNFFQILIKMASINTKNNKSKYEKKYQQIIQGIIENGKKIINNTLKEKSKFNKERDYSLNSDPILTKELKESSNKIKWKSSIDELSMMYQCYNPYNEEEVLEILNNRVLCESYHKSIDSLGVWDRKCVKDEECPFYQSNKNYPNNFGGCVEGGCQMPLGIRRIGKRKIDNESVPLCYNCPEEHINKSSSLKENKNCCFLQSDDSKLLSPDYIFERDKPTREKNKDVLKRRGLRVI